MINEKRIVIEEKEFDSIIESKDMFKFDFSFKGRNFVGIGFEGALNLDKPLAFQKLNVFTAGKEIVFFKNESIKERFVPCDADEYEYLNCNESFYIWAFEKKHYFKKISMASSELSERIETAYMN